MTPKEVSDWLAAMRAAGHLRFEKQAADLLGVSPQAIRLWKAHGVTGDTAVRTQLACAALLAGIRLQPPMDRGAVHKYGIGPPPPSK
jgi:hypothetical protein